MMSEDNFREFYGWVTTPDEAKAAAKSSGRRIERAKKTVELTMPGTLAIPAGAIVSLAGFRPDISGRYKAVIVRQSLSRAGWVTSISCEGA
jgi:uncharacterized protein